MKHQIQTNERSFTPSKLYSKEFLDKRFSQHHVKIQKIPSPDIEALEVEHDNRIIETANGTMTANKGDFIVKNLDNNYFVVKKELFHKTYSILKLEHYVK